MTDVKESTSKRISELPQAVSDGLALEPTALFPVLDRGSNKALELVELADSALPYLSSGGDLAELASLEVPSIPVVTQNPPMSRGYLPQDVLAIQMVALESRAGVEDPEIARVAIIEGDREDERGIRLRLVPVSALGGPPAPAGASSRCVFDFNDWGDPPIRVDGSTITASWQSHPIFMDEDNYSLGNGEVTVATEGTYRVELQVAIRFHDSYGQVTNSVVPNTGLRMGIAVQGEVASFVGRGHSYHVLPEGFGIPVMPEDDRHYATVTAIYYIHAYEGVTYTPAVVLGTSGGINTRCNVKGTLTLERIGDIGFGV